MSSEGTPLLRSRRVLYLFLGLYAATLIFLIPGKPLWMDEIIDLSGVRDVSDVHGVLAFVPLNAGGVPLGYLVDFAMIRLFGYSVFIVRLPSVLFTVLTCAGVYILARQTRFRMPLMAVILYAVSPLTWRYALEARPYAQAACWSVFSTVVFLALIRQPAFGKAAAYAVLVVAGLYTQPYSIFVPVAHLFWLLFTASVKEKPRAIVLAGTAVALASLAFLPWFLNAQAAWQGTVNSGARFLVTGKDLLVIPHELMGTGFIGAALTVIAIVMALGWSSWNREEKNFWTHYAVIPLLLVPAADAYFGYFLAARQLIFVLVPISVLLVACMEIRWGWLVPAALLLAMVYEDAHWIRRPGEAWQAAAVQLKQAGCTLFVPSGARTLYLFFEPQIRVCDDDENALTSVGSVALAVSPDQPASDARQKLNQAGFRKVADLRTTDPRIELYRR
jgi:4-amino-4-deoxy-L-arabinose transferase-like glycosyltransferase